MKIANALSCSCNYILLGIKGKEGTCGMESVDTQLLKGFNERQCKIITEILQLLIELNEEMMEYEL